MSYRIEGQDIVISGFEDGIADDPYKGISDMRNIENSSIPGEASVAFATTNTVTQTAMTSITVTASSSSGLLFTRANGGTLEDNTAIIFSNSGGALPTGVVTNKAYYVVNSTATTFKISATAGGSAIAFTDAGTGTTSFSTINMSKPKFTVPLTTASSAGFTYLYFSVDDNGRVWYYYNSSQWIYLKNLDTAGENNAGGTTGNNGNGLVIFGNYLVLFTQSSVSYLKVKDNNTVLSLATLTTAANWVHEWQFTNSELSTTTLQNEVSSIGQNDGGATQRKKLAQSVSYGLNVRFSSIAVALRKSGSPTSTISITIEADNSGDPSGTPLFTSDSMSASSLTTTTDYYTFTFSSAVTLDANTTYWIVLNSNTLPAEGDYIEWRGSATGDVYANGSAQLLDVSDTWVAISNADFNLHLLTSETNYPATVSHFALVGQDNAVYFCNTNYVGSIIVLPGQEFDPSDVDTYTYNNFALAIPVEDSSTCLAELGVNLLIGGTKNQIYPWDRVSTSYSYPILLAENNVQQMVTVNTNTYIFAGQRGKIYITNGSQAQFFKKVPDHLSGTTTPYYTWGGATFNRNQLFFGVQATTNAGVAINQYGGLWAIDLVTNGIRLINQLSYGTYSGIASAIFPLLGSPTSDGYGLLIGWYTTIGGIDKGSANPYTGGQSYFDCDMIPIGTYLKPFTGSQIEWKTSTPLVSGENIQLYWRSNITGSYTLIPTDTSSLIGVLSDVVKVNFEKVQWIQLRAVLTSTDTTPSYCRLTEIRIRNWPNT